jgi:hypothetical protein
METKMASKSASNEEPGVLGYLSLAVVIFIIAWAIYAGYARFLRPPAPVISLSAYFLDTTNGTANSPELKIRGQAHLNGHALKDGDVRLTVTRQEPPFEQSVLTDLKAGVFEVGDSSFKSLLPNDQIHISAQVSSSEFNGTATDELYLNTGPPSLSLSGEIALWVTVVTVIGVFLFAFTGMKTAWKNRTAIVLSYCIIGISLAVPLLAPVLLLRAFPRARCAMNVAPAGIVVTPIGEGSDVHTQWALNIGGYSTQQRADSSDTVGNSDTSSNASIGKTEGKSTASKNPGNAPDVTSTSVPISQDSPQGKSTTPTLTPTQTASPSGNLTSPDGDSVGHKDPLKGSKNLRSSGNLACSDVVRVDGGIVIPLYVIILSIIGGAINMTRKVPRYQREGEHSEVSFPMGRLFSLKGWKKYASSDTSQSLRIESVRGAEDTEKGKGDPSQTGSVSASAGASARNAGTEAPATGIEDAKKDNNPRQSGSAGTVAHDGPDSTGAKDIKKDNNSTQIKPVPTATQNVSMEKPEDGQEGKIEDGGADAHDERPSAETAGEIDSQLDALVKEQVSRTSDTDSTMSRIRTLVQQMRDLFDSKKTDDRILGCESFEDWLGNRANLKELLGSNWRVELLNQYMYLVSAPFLAMVAYYLLELLGVAARQPIVVLISFSVGLISERIVSSILGVATGYLRGGGNSQPAGQQG